MPSPKLNAPISPAQVTISLLGPAWQKVELGMFIFMGWLVLPSVRYIYECIDPLGFAWLCVGGLFYSTGAVLPVAFFRAVPSLTSTNCKAWLIWLSVPARLIIERGWYDFCGVLPLCVP